MSASHTVTVPLREDPDGTLRVGTTRVPLDTLVHVFDEGATPEEIVQRFPALDLVDVYAVVSFYLQNREEVERYLERRRSEAISLRRKIEGHASATGLRERLLARRDVSVFRPE